MKRIMFIVLLVCIVRPLFGANVVHKITKRYLKSVHTPNYMNGEWLINPKLPNCESKYWKIVGDKIIEMTKKEKVKVDIFILKPITEKDKPDTGIIP